MSSQSYYLRKGTENGEKMPLKFNCHNCQKEIISDNLETGQIMICPHCEGKNIVPETAVGVSEDEIKSEPTYADKLKQQMQEYEQRKTEKNEKIWQKEDELLKQRGFPIVVAALLGINVLMLALMDMMGGSTDVAVLFRFGAQLNNAVVSGQYWRLFTSMFLHIGFWHLIFNCLALFFFGRNLEWLYGRTRFIIIYFASGYFGNLLFLAFGPSNIISAGASGAIFGVIGANIPLKRRLRQSELFTNRRMIMAGIGYVAWIFFRSMGPKVNVLAHLGGVLAGIVLGFMLCPKYLSVKEEEKTENFRYQEESGWFRYAVIIILVFASFTFLSFLRAHKDTIPFGRMLQFKSGQLLYTKSVSKAEAMKLGDYLVVEGIFDDNPKTAQIGKTGDKYELRLVVQDTFSDSLEYKIIFQMLGSKVSREVFDNAPLDIHLCNDKLETLEVLESSSIQSEEEMARMILESSLKLEPNNPSTHVMLGNIYRQQGDSDRAIAEYKIAINLDPDLPEAHGNLALTYQEMGMLDMAIWEYEEALRLDSKSAFLMNNLAWGYVSKGIKLEEAVPLARKAVELEPNNANNLDTLGWAYWKNGETQQALKSFGEVMKTTQSGDAYANSRKGILEIIQSGLEPETFLDLYNKLVAVNTGNIIYQIQIRVLSAEFHLSRMEQSQAQEALIEAEGIYSEAGFPEESQWMVIGPFNNPDNAGLNMDHPLESNIDFSAIYAGKADEVGWKQADDGQMDGQLDLIQMFTPNVRAFAYAFIRISSVEEQEAQLRIGSDDGIKIWLNDEVVWNNRVNRTLKMDADTVPIKLKAGDNKLLLKIDQGIGEWGVIMRLTDNQGNPLKNLSYGD